MKELSLHILDLAENSINAGASLIKILIDEDIENDLFKLCIKDNGKGMSKELLKNVDNPFVTTRKTRKVGMGISLMKLAAQRCGGNLQISSKVNKGTKLKCKFIHSHIDRAPLGSMSQTLVSLINNNSNIDILYVHKYNDEKFIFDTKKIKEILGEVQINSIEVLLWIKDYIKENEKKIYYK